MSARPTRPTRPTRPFGTVGGTSRFPSSCSLRDGRLRNILQPTVGRTVPSRVKPPREKPVHRGVEAPTSSLFLGFHGRGNGLAHETRRVLLYRHRLRACLLVDHGEVAGWVSPSHTHRIRVGMISILWIAAGLFGMLLAIGGGIGETPWIMWLGGGMVILAFAGLIRNDVRSLRSRRHSSGE